MKNKTPNKIKKKSAKKKYKIRNWHDYNEMLVQRGNIFLWIEQDAQDNWNNAPRTGKPGAPRNYSDIAIQACLTLKSIFHLNLRSVEGCINSLFAAMDINLKSPDYSTLSIRSKTLKVNLYSGSNHLRKGQDLHIVIDSSGAKVYGEGEWKVRQHGWSKRRTWKKFHIAIDAAGKKFKSVEVTGNDAADCQELEPLIDGINEPIGKVSTDGAYDRHICYDALVKRGIDANIPPRKNARIWQHGNSSSPPLARDENLRRIRRTGIKR